MEGTPQQRLGDQKATAAKGTAKWVSERGDGLVGKDRVAEVLECQSEEIGPHSMGDGEAVTASNRSSILGRLGWQRLKSAI